VEVPRVVFWQKTDAAGKGSRLVESRMVPVTTNCE